MPQVVGDPEHPTALDGLERVRNEYVVRIGGTLRRRKDPNPRLPTGNLELVAEKVGPAGLGHLPMITPISPSGTESGREREGGRRNQRVCER